MFFEKSLRNFNFTLWGMGVLNEVNGSEQGLDRNPFQHHL